MDNYINLNKERRPSVIQVKHDFNELEDMINNTEHQAVLSKKKPKNVKKKKKNIFSWIKKTFCSSCC
jgi:hypothetical protein